jgi:glycosyltransferase involved in cell wall biosynthesis
MVNPDSLKAWFSLGNLRQAQGQLKAAEEAYQQAIAGKPDLAEARYNLGVVLQGQGQLDEAIICYQRTLEFNPDYTEVYLNLAQIYQQQNNLEEGIFAYRQWLELINPCYAKAVEAYPDSAVVGENHPTPSIPQGEVVVGNYSFPTIYPVADDTEPRPFWSVVVTVYNRTDYLLQCLGSVLAQWQGREQMEIIVIDDASTTPVFELVNSIGQGVIRYYRNPQNLGLPGNWNAGIALTRGRWIHLLHDDDYILPGFYSRLQESLEGCADTVGAAFSGYQNINQVGEVIFRQQVYSEQRGIAQNWLQRIGVRNSLNMSAVVIRRSVHEGLGVYHPELTYTSDWELYIRIAATYDWWYEPEILACYREHSGSKTTELLLSGMQMTSIRRAIEISESYLAVDRAEITAQSRKYHFKYCLRSTAIPLEKENLDGAWGMLEEALKIDRSPEGVLELFTWLTREESAPLRREIASRLTLISQDS